MQKITIIAAISLNNCIGIDNKLPWHIPEDLQFFKSYTLNKPIIMGRKTWDSLPKKPLTNRTNIILTTNKNLMIKDGVIFNNINEILTTYSHEQELCIIGGADIYKHTINIVTDLIITRVHLNINGDKFFPIDINKSPSWQEISKTKHVSKNKNINFELIHYQKN